MKTTSFNRTWSPQNWAAVCGLLVLAVLLRVVLLPATNGDYRMFLHPWFQEIQQNGGFAALSNQIGDYTPLYMYLLAFLTYFPGHDLTLIKTASCVADFVLAFLVMRIVQEYRPEPWAGVAAFFVTLFFPPVFLNSAAWGQCDAMYICGLLACFYGCLHKRSWMAMLGFSIAFALKLQTVFFAPFVLWLLVRRHLKWRSLLLIPAVYLASVIPAVLLGRNFKDLLLIYWNQSHGYNQLCMGIPNLYAFFGPAQNEILGKAGVLFAGGVVLLALLFLWRGRAALDHDLLLNGALFSLFLVPYLLPYMHERYYMPADIFGILYAFRFPKRIYIPLALAVADTLGQANFTFGLQENPVELMSLVILAALVALAAFLYRTAGYQRREAAA